MFSKYFVSILQLQELGDLQMALKLKEEHIKLKYQFAQLKREHQDHISERLQLHKQVGGLFMVINDLMYREPLHTHLKDVICIIVPILVFVSPPTLVGKGPPCFPAHLSFCDYYVYVGKGEKHHTWRRWLQHCTQVSMQATALLHGSNSPYPSRKLAVLS